MKTVKKNTGTYFRKLAILYICTGKYQIFWETFYSSSKEFLLTKHHKHYFVFTDSNSITANGNITVIYKKHEGFPIDSLLRFRMFNSISDRLKDYDYVFFFNSNLNFVAPVNEEIFPDDYISGLTGVLHPGYFNKNYFWFPYERNPASKAMIAHKYSRYRYYMGIFFGGRTEAFNELSEKCDGWIRDDLKQGIIAVYHDESHLNRYFIGREILEMYPSYGYPEGWKLPFTPRIIILNKVIHGGPEFDKMAGISMMKKVINKFMFIIKTVKWYYK